MISNAGGVNPQACAAALQTACDHAGVALKIAVLLGDDLQPQIRVGDQVKNRQILLEVE
ncbi:hypothetical protein J2W17_001736 [Pseudomonas lini]|nr:hypothetical protein [Pseudomonas lini]